MPFFSGVVSIRLHPLEGGKVATASMPEGKPNANGNKVADTIQQSLTTGGWNEAVLELRTERFWTRFRSATRMVVTIVHFDDQKETFVVRKGDSQSDNWIAHSTHIVRLARTEGTVIGEARIILEAQCDNDLVQRFGNGMSLPTYTAVYQYSHFPCVPQPDVRERYAGLHRDPIKGHRNKEWIDFAGSQARDRGLPIKGSREFAQEGREVSRTPPSSCPSVCNDGLSDCNTSISSGSRDKRGSLDQGAADRGNDAPDAELLKRLDTPPGCISPRSSPTQRHATQSMQRQISQATKDKLALLMSLPSETQAFRSQPLEVRKPDLQPDVTLPTIAVPSQASASMSVDQETPLSPFNEDDSQAAEAQRSLEKAPHTETSSSALETTGHEAARFLDEVNLLLQESIRPQDIVPSEGTDDRSNVQQSVTRYSSREQPEEEADSTSALPTHRPQQVDAAVIPAAELSTSEEASSMPRSIDEYSSSASLATSADVTEDPCEASVSSEPSTNDAGGELAETRSVACLTTPRPAPLLALIPMTSAANEALARETEAIRAEIEELKREEEEERLLLEREEVERLRLEKEERLRLEKEEHDRLVAELAVLNEELEVRRAARVVRMAARRERSVVGQRISSSAGSLVPTHTDSSSAKQKTGDTSIEERVSHKIIPATASPGSSSAKKGSSGPQANMSKLEPPASNMIVEPLETAEQKPNSITEDPQMPIPATSLSNASLKTPEKRSSQESQPPSTLFSPPLKETPQSRSHESLPDHVMLNSEHFDQVDGQREALKRLPAFSTAQRSTPMPSGLVSGYSSPSSPSSTDSLFIPTEPRSMRATPSPMVLFLPPEAQEVPLAPRSERMGGYVDQSRPDTWRPDPNRARPSRGRTSSPNLIETAMPPREKSVEPTLAATAVPPRQSDGDPQREQQGESVQPTAASSNLYQQPKAVSPSREPGKDPRQRPASLTKRKAEPVVGTTEDYNVTPLKKRKTGLDATPSTKMDAQKSLRKEDEGYSPDWGSRAVDQWDRVR